MLFKVCPNTFHVQTLGDAFWNKKVLRHSSPNARKVCNPSHGALSMDLSSYSLIRPCHDIHVYSNEYVRMYNTHICICTCTCTYLETCILVSTYICIHTHMYLNMYSGRAPKGVAPLAPGLERQRLAPATPLLGAARRRGSGARGPG